MKVSPAEQAAPEQKAKQDERASAAERRGAAAERLYLLGDEARENHPGVFEHYEPRIADVDGRLVLHVYCGRCAPPMVLIAARVGQFDPEQQGLTLADMVTQDGLSFAEMAWQVLRHEIEEHDGVQL